MKKRYSAFDYTVTVRRKQRYLVVSCPELGLSVGSASLDLGTITPSSLGEGVLRLLELVSARLLEYEKRGEEPPRPLSRIFAGAQETVGVSVASRLTGVPRSQLRRLAREGKLESRRTPGGHLRFSLDALARVAA